MKKVKFLKKGATMFVALNVLASSAVTSLPAAVSAAPSTGVKTSLFSSSVTPVNMLKDFESTAVGFKYWDAYFNGVLVPEMSKNENSEFILGHKTFAKQIDNGVYLYNKSDNLGTISQTVHVEKGETYEFSFTAEGTGRIMYGVSDKISGEEKPNGDKKITYVAPETKDVRVVIAYAHVGVAGDKMDITNVSLKNTDVTPPDAPTINPIYTDTNLATGKAEPNTTVILTTEDGQVVKGQVDNEGNYSVKLPRQIMGHVVRVANQDIAGNTSDEVTSLPVRQGELEKPTINEVTNDSTTITGEADLAVNVNIKVIKPGGSEQAYVTNTDNKGHFVVEIAKPEYGDKVQAVTSGNGKVSEVSEILVKDAVKPAAPTVNDIYTDTIKLEGKGTYGNKIEVTLPTGGTKTASVAEDGTFSVDIPAQAEGSKIKVIQIKPSGVKGDATTKTVLPGDLPQPIVNEITDQSTKIEGTATPNADFKIVIADKDGSAVKNPYVGTVDSTGKFSILIDKLLPSYTVTMTLTKGDQVSKPKVIQVKDVTAPDMPIVNNITADDKAITGKGEAGSTAIAKVNGQEIGQATVGEDGQFSISIKPQAEKTVVNVTLVDAAGNISKAAEKTVSRSTKTDLSVPESLKVGTTTFSGSYGANIFKVRLFVNGEVVAQATTKDGTYTFNNVDKLVLSVNDKVEVVGVDKNYATVKTLPVKVTGEDIKVLSADKYSFGAEQLTGKYEDVAYKVRLFVNGEVKAQATLDPSTHTFKFVNADHLITGPTDKVEVVAVNKRYEEIYRGDVEVEASTANQLTVQPYTMGSETLEGTHGTSVYKVRLAVNGSIVAQATNSAGKYAFKNVSQFITSNQDKVEVIAVNSKYQEINRQSVKLEGELNTLSYNPYNAGDKTLSGSYGKGISKVRLFVNDKVVAQATTDEATKTFSFANVDRFITAATDKVELVAVDSQYKEVKRVAVEVSNAAGLDTLTVDSSYKLGTDNLTGSYGTLGFKVRLFVNGVVKTQAVAENGKYKFENLSNLKITADDKVEVVLVNNAYKEINRISVDVVQ
ncbi:Ig-like domain-containing protein [Listeria sp. PSOL-1]|uniref:Ig-like domain-containing protein n=1 Tax=Listeria sp. PSOL-1 TaxID=1844999 RepID=UPI0013D40371|nr:Ig-like domain-containing protein [Listeria sp. PSOL-1]